MSKEITPDLLARERVLLRTTLSRSTLRELVIKGEFPQPVQIPGSRRIAWNSGEVDEWIANLKRAKWPTAEQGGSHE